MVDRRIVPNLTWIAKRFPIYITTLSRPPRQRARLRPLPHARLRPLHGLAVDMSRSADSKCDACLAGNHPPRALGRAGPEPPRPPFRWVGYDGDAGHGCGNHLHLSWNHAPTAEFRLAEWVEVFPGDGAVGGPLAAGRNRRRSRARAGRRSLARPDRRRLAAPRLSPPRLGARRAGSPPPGVSIRPWRRTTPSARRMRRCAAARIASLLPVSPLAGCGSTDDRHADGLPRRAGALPAALGRRRSGRPRGGMPISECLTENQAAGDLADVGGAMVAAATRLNAEARAGPAGRPTCGSATSSAPPSGGPKAPRASTRSWSAGSPRRPLQPRQAGRCRRLHPRLPARASTRAAPAAEGRAARRSPIRCGYTLMRRHLG